MLALFWSQWSHPQTNFPSLNEKWICRVEWLTPHNIQELLDSDDVRPRKLLCTFNDKQMREKENEKEKYSWIQRQSVSKTDADCWVYVNPHRMWFIHCYIYKQVWRFEFIIHARSIFLSSPGLDSFFFVLFCSLWYCHRLWDICSHMERYLNSWL